VRPVDEETRKEGKYDIQGHRGQHKIPGEKVEGIDVVKEDGFLEGK
jgi:hypothetical protein